MSKLARNIKHCPELENFLRAVHLSQILIYSEGITKESEKTEWVKKIEIALKSIIFPMTLRTW